MLALLSIFFAAILILPANKETTIQTQDEIAKIKATNSIDEQAKLYRQLIERTGPEEAQEQLLRSGLPFTGQTHLLNHVIGDYLYEKYGTAGLVRCRDYFLSSCYHGFILHAIGSGGIDEINSAMSECSKKGSPVMSQCAHAVGHGFLAWLGYPNLTGALELCDEMEERSNNFPLYNCQDGVFMENIWGIHGGAPSPDRWVNPNDVVYPCNDPRIKYEYINACWSNQPALMYRYFRGDVKKIGEECLKVNDTTHQKTCFNGLARQIHPITKSNVDIAFQYCEQMPQDWIDYCLTTITTADFSVGGRDMSFQICARIGEQGKEQCYQNLFAAMKAYSPMREDYEKLCQKILEDEWRQRCLERSR